MRQTSGIIINNDIFINSSHVVKILKRHNGNLEHIIDIYTTNETKPISLYFKSADDCCVIFNRIIMELYGHNYAVLNYEEK